MRNNRLKISAFLLLLGFAACSIHHVQIEGPVSAHKKKAREPDPVPLFLRPSAATKDVHRLFQRSRRLQLNRGANVEIRYRVDRIPKDKPGAETMSALLFCLTLGIFPSVEQDELRITFDAFDRSANRTVKSYRYYLTDRTVNSWITIPFSVILAPFFDSIEWSSLGAKIDAPYLMAFKKFESDLLKDLNDRTFADRFFSIRSRQITRYALLDFAPAGDHLAGAAYKSVETELVRAGLSLVERERVRALHRELARSQTGLTASSLRIGRMSQAAYVLLGKAGGGSRKVTVELKCVEIETGDIVWKQSVTEEGTRPLAGIRKAAKKLARELIESGFN